MFEDVLLIRCLNSDDIQSGEKSILINTYHKL
ncbi:hypothetical protein CPS_3672 [Colwellia psychrerythraea 34H]|uniref:Uncharacterized protein n=1 Tax=Colwellia psychrerythraea (strain 34H / ATCC BAA-681) TaxID=167879 RepID=Q47XY0_COLP3|nr:hypothetical protein CPS_3672 [Colwellia psychrerythraea 34H]